MFARILTNIILFALPAIAFSSSSLSQTYFISATDVSMSYLANMFGNVGDVLVGASSTPLVANIFYYFNQGIYIFTGALLTYIVLSSVIATSNEGKFITDKFNSWILIRSGLAISFLVPLTSGYCMIQVVVMWAITQGIGLANNLWSEAVVNISSAGYFGNTVFSSDTEATTQQNVQYSPTYTQDIAIGSPPGSYEPTVSSSNPAVPMIQIFRSAFCAYTSYQYDLAGAKTSGSQTPDRSNYGFFSKLNSDGSQNICFGSRAMNSDGSVAYNCQCGEYTFNSGNDSVDLTSFNNMYTMASLFYNYSQSLYGTINDNNDSSAIQTDGSSVDMSKVCQVLSSDNTNEANCISASTLYSYSSDYNSMIASVQSNQASSGADTSSCPDWVSFAQDQGWIMAAAYYSNLVNQNNSSCGSAGDVSLYTAFLPLVAGTTNSNIVNCDYSNMNNTCVSYPCMTPASGYGTDTSTLCSPLYLDKTTQSNWNAFYSSSLASNVLNNVYGSGGTEPTGIQYITQSMQTTPITTNPITNTTFDDYFNGMLQSFLQNFVINIYEPGDVGYDLMTQGGGRYVVNGTATLVSYVVAQILGIDIYSGASADSIFANNIMSTGTPGTNPNCGSCYSSVNYAGGSGGTCFDTNSPPITSCINTDGYGMFGMASKYRNGLPFLDPLTSIATVGRNIMKYTISFQTNLISNIFYGLKELTGQIVGGFIGAAAGLSLLGFLGAFSGSTVGYMLPMIQMCVEIIFQAHLTILFTYLPFAIALTVIFITIGLLLGMYLPFLPIIMFTSGVISWFISVVEAMAAAPLIAMGVTNPKGHELLGRAEQALILLLGVFVRPSTMIIGFIGAIALSYASMYLLNLTFAYAFTQGLNSQLQNNSGYGVSVLGGLLYSIVYAYSCYAILSQTFSLIFQVPDKVLRWIGSPRDTTGRDAMAMLGGSKGGLMGAGSEMAEKGGGGSMRQAQKSAPNLSALQFIDYSSTVREAEEVVDENSSVGTDTGDIRHETNKGRSTFDDFNKPKSSWESFKDVFKTPAVKNAHEANQAKVVGKSTSSMFRATSSNAGKYRANNEAKAQNLLAGKGALSGIARTAKSSDYAFRAQRLRLEAKARESAWGGAESRAKINSLRLKAAALETRAAAIANPEIMRAENLSKDADRFQKQADKIDAKVSVEKTKLENSKKELGVLQGKIGMVGSFDIRGNRLDKEENKNEINRDIEITKQEISDSESKIASLTNKSAELNLQSQDAKDESNRIVNKELAPKPSNKNVVSKITIHSDASAFNYGDKSPTTTSSLETLLGVYKTLGVVKQDTQDVEMGFNMQGDVVLLTATDNNGVQRQLQEGIKTEDLTTLLGNKYGVDVNQIEPKQRQEIMNKLNVLSDQINTSITSINEAATNDFKNALENEKVELTFDTDNAQAPKPYVPENIQKVQNFNWADQRPVGGSGDSITGVGSSEEHKYDISDNQMIHKQMQQAAIEQSVEAKAEQEASIISVMQKLQQQKNDWIQSLGGATDAANPDNTSS